MRGDEPKVGPRGGTTTYKKGQVKKSLWLNDDEAEAVRDAAYEQRRPEAAIIREAIRVFFDLDD